MRANLVRLPRGVRTLVVLLLLGTSIPHDSASGQAGPVRVSGGGEATAAAFVQYVGHDNVLRNVPSINTIGNRITFGFNAKKDARGYVEGQMQLVDHTEGLIIHSDVANLSVPAWGAQQAGRLGRHHLQYERFDRRSHGERPAPTGLAVR